MKSLIRVLTCLFLSILLVACSSGNKVLQGKGKVVTDQRTVKSFNTLSISGMYDVQASIGGDKTTVVVKASENLLPYIETEVKKSVLYIKVKKGYLFATNAMPQISITVPQLEGANVSGYGQFNVQGLKTNTFTATLSGSGLGELSGVVDALHLKISGSGQFKTKDLLAKTIDVVISGSGNAVVSPQDRLDANISGSGTVQYYGKPEHVNTSIAGSGSVIDVNENAPQAATASTTSQPVSATTTSTQVPTTTNTQEGKDGSVH